MATLEGEVVDVLPSNGTKSRPIKASDRLEIRPMRIERLEITIVGESPLLCHAKSERALRQIEEGKRGKGSKNEEPTEGELFDEACYRLADGAFAFPVGRAIKVALVDAGRCCGQSMELLRRVISVKANLAPIIGPRPVLHKSYPVNKQGNTVLSIKARFDEWAIAVPVEYITTRMSREDVVELFAYAGFCNGLGSERQEKNGAFGQFRVESVKVQDFRRYHPAQTGIGGKE